MPWYHYFCDNCDRTATRTEYVERVDCKCSVGERTYRGYTDDGGSRYAWDAQDQRHYWTHPQHGTQHWYDSVTGAWYPRYGQPPVHADAEAEQAVAEAVAAQERFPVSDGTMETCARAWAAYGVREGGRRRQALAMLQGFVLTAQRSEAWTLLSQWNNAYPDQRMSIQDIGLSPADEPQPLQAAPVAEDPQPAPQQESIVFRGESHPVDVFSDDGGFHRVLSVSGDRRLIHAIPNEELLIRVPRAGARTPRSGVRNGREWEQRGFNIPTIHNRATAEQDGFYVVERVPLAFNGINANHVRQVNAILVQMSRSGTGPDFRPANIRFRANGEMVLIDFDDPADNAVPLSTLEEFIRQFAAVGTPLYAQLRNNIDPVALEEMDTALMSYEG